jgi:hypothetical protein
MTRNPTPSRPARRGVVAVLVAISLVMLVGFAAIAVDGGLLYLHLRKARSGADASAMAAACELFRHYPAYQGRDTDGSAEAAARAVASANGYANDGTNSTVVVNIPPQSGIYAGKDSYAEVIITYNVQRAFSRIWGADPIPVRARAVSRGAWVPSKTGVLILDYDDKAALSDQGNGAFTETGGFVVVNSNNPSAVVTSGNGIIKAQQFYITGGETLNGGGNLVTQPVAGQVFTGTHPTPDPYAYLPQPTMPPAGTMTQTSIGNGNFQYVLTPGSYTNLPTFNTGDVVILQQASANSAGGIFYINGGGFKSTGATITMDPNTSGGVMLYNAPASSASSEKLQITGNAAGTVNLSGLTTGPYAGMVLWQDRNSSVDMLVEGNGSFTINGTFYAASALLSVAGNGATTGSYVDDSGSTVTGGSRIGSNYVSKDLAISGNGNVNVNYPGTKANTRILTLVE